MPDLLGIHHVTAIAGDPQADLDFATGVLGLHLLKVTVNFDDPHTYHLYYGDAEGRPGSVWTTFPWAHAPRGRVGAGQPTLTVLAAPAGSLGGWETRLRAAGLAIERAAAFGRDRLTFEDPAGLPFAIEESDAAGEELAGFAGVAITVRDPGPTDAVLTEHLGFRRGDASAGVVRYWVGGTYVDVTVDATGPRGLQSSGTIHHVAFRAADDDAQLRWRERLLSAGHNVTPVRDRYYFHSIYFHEPGGVLFEIATDPPGFAADEVPGALGTAFKLPPTYEPRRAEIEAAVQPIHLPGGARLP